MSRFLHEDFQSITPYTPGEQPKDEMLVLKLNTNESPFPPAPGVQASLMPPSADMLRLYPDPELYDLKKTLADEYGVSSCNVFCANGSDDVLAFAFMSFIGRNGKIAAPNISYGFYPVYAALFHADMTQIPLCDDLTIDHTRYLNLDQNIVIANPNAPTGLMLSIDKIEEIVKTNPDHVVIVDEAYADFSGETVVSLTCRYDNLLVVRTFSKSRSLAGLRFGFAIGNEALIADLERIRFSFNPYNVNRLTIKAACASVADRHYFESCVDQIIKSRTYLIKTLRELGFTVTDSKTNFVFAKHRQITGERFTAKLREKGILIRHFGHPTIKDYMRITVGTMDQMHLLIDTIQAILKEEGL